MWWLGHLSWPAAEHLLAGTSGSGTPSSQPSPEPESEPTSSQSRLIWLLAAVRCLCRRLSGRHRSCFLQHQPSRQGLRRDSACVPRYAATVPTLLLWQRHILSAQSGHTHRGPLNQLPWIGLDEWWPGVCCTASSSSESSTGHPLRHAGVTPLPTCSLSGSAGHPQPCHAQLPSLPGSLAVARSQMSRTGAGRG